MGFRHWLLRPVLNMERRIMARIDDLIADEGQLKIVIGGLATAISNASAQITQLKAQVGDNAALVGQLDDLHASLQADLATATAALPAAAAPPTDSPVADTSAQPLPDTGDLSTGG